MKEGIDRKEKKSLANGRGFVACFFCAVQTTASGSMITALSWRAFFADVTLFERSLRLRDHLGPPHSNEEDERPRGPYKDSPRLYLLSSKRDPFLFSCSPAFLQLSSGLSRACIGCVGFPGNYLATRPQPSRVIKRTNRKRRDPVKASPKRKGVRLRPYRRWPLRSAATPARPFGYLSRVVLSIAPLPNPV